MSFISFSFLLLFFLTLLGRFLLGPAKIEKSYLAFLLVASLVFYGSFIPSYLLILFFTTAVDYWAGRKIFENRSPGRRKFFLVLSLTANLGLLGFFKYTNFALGTVRRILDVLHLGSSGIPHLDLALPIGISFFTFQSMSYTIDIYRGQIEPVASYPRFLLFVSFFTHLVCGPIVRARELLYQFGRKRRIRTGVALQGFYLMILGFFLKMVVADNLAAYVNRYWERGAAPGMAASVPWTLAFLFSCQIFADFFGYTNIAMGAAYLLGFKLPDNFRSPYIAGSFREFWTRWHITLSRWIRDYLYIPLGGNRGGGLKPYRTLLLTMILAGLWHGAAFTFLIWGGLHGLALAVERGLGLSRMEGRSRALRLSWFLLVQVLVLIGWVFFRAQGMGQAFRFLANMAENPLRFHDVFRIAPAFLFASPVLLMHGRVFLAERGWLKPPRPAEKAVLCAAMLYCVMTVYGKNNAFIYFQF